MILASSRSISVARDVPGRPNFISDGAKPGGVKRHPRRSRPAQLLPTARVSGSWVGSLARPIVKGLPMHEVAGARNNLRRFQGLDEASGMVPAKVHLSLNVADASAKVALDA